MKQQNNIKNLADLLTKYRDGLIKIELEDIIWEAVKCGLTAVPANGITYLCKNGSWLIRLDKEKNVEFAKELSYYNVVEDVI